MLTTLQRFRTLNITDILSMVNNFIITIRHKYLRNGEQQRSRFNKTRSAVDYMQLIQMNLYSPANTKSIRLRDGRDDMPRHRVVNCLIIPILQSLIRF